MARDDDGPVIEIADEGTEVMVPSPEAAGDDGYDEPEDNPLVAETRRIRADEVTVQPALPFGDAREVSPAAAAEVVPPADRRAVPAPESPEAVTEAVRRRRAPSDPLPFAKPLAPGRSDPTPEQLDEIVWRSKVGIDPSDLPSAQLVVPPATEASARPFGRAARRGRRIGLVVLGLALVAGFAVVALALLW